MAERRDTHSLLWANRSRKQDNVIVLNDRAVFVTTLKAKDIARASAAFVLGDTPQDVLDSYRVIPLGWISAFEYQYSTIYRMAQLTLVYDKDGVEQRSVLSFATAADRDTFRVELNARLGKWL